MGRGIDDVLLAETQLRIERRGVPDHAGGQCKQVFGDERDLLPALLKHHHAREQPLVLTDRLGAGACPPTLVDVGHGGDVGAADADAQLRWSRLRRRGHAQSGDGACWERDRAPDADTPVAGTAQSRDGARPKWPAPRRCCAVDWRARSRRLT